MAMKEGAGRCPSKEMNARWANGLAKLNDVSILRRQEWISSRATFGLCGSEFSASRQLTIFTAFDQHDRTTDRSHREISIKNAPEPSDRLSATNSLPPQISHGTNPAGKSATVISPHTHSHSWLLRPDSRFRFWRNHFHEGNSSLTLLADSVNDCSSNGIVWP